MNDLRGYTLQQLTQMHGSLCAAIDWVSAEIRAGRVKRYWRDAGECLVVYRRVG